MYGILEDIEKLLAAKEFWYALIGINVVFFAGQPVLIALTVAGVLLLYFIRCVGKSLQSSGVLGLVTVTFIGMAFFGTWLVIAGLLQATGVTDLFIFVGLPLNFLLWAILRSLRRRWVDARERRRRPWEERREQRRYQAERDRQAREKEQAARAAEERAQQTATGQQRRDEARARCEALYRLHAPEIRDRFPKADFDDFVSKYLNDKQGPEDVERRAEQLKAIIEQHRRKIDPPKKKMSLADLAQWFLKEKAEIDAVPLSDEDKEALVAQLEARYAKLQEKHIRGIEV